MNMKKLSEEKLVDYVDGALSPEEQAHVEAYLRENPEEAELVELMRMAMPAVKDWHESEPLRVSENFWPKLRDNLGPAPQRGLLSKLRNQVAGAFAPRATRLSFGVAAVAVVLALSAFWFAPQGTVQNSVATPITAADRSFMKVSREKHEAYLRAQPIAPGDASIQETGADDVEEENNP